MIRNWTMLAFSLFFGMVSLRLEAQTNFDKSHALWDKLLQKHVSGGWVSYTGFRADSQELQTYLSSLSSVSESQYNAFSEAEKLSFLINAYNAFTVKLILDHYPVDSITEIGGPFSKLNLARGLPWKKEFFVLLGKQRHLDWIEHEKLRKDFAEPRIHFAIVCASVGCPELANRAYAPKELTSQLQAAKLQFLRNSKKNHYDPKTNTLHLSKIFHWFQGDFTKNGSLVDFVSEGFSTKIPADVTIEFNEYSWKLNERK